ncbi:MFS transporter [Williamsia serinedens]|uniref:Drug resistance transporter, EmrB/QacA subfamily n=1 Tax=Williamsia serinedens TaxID=391736 RepID=A0ABT1GVH1_9NOCA|nr:MFS transporter [Williamsia serinedens]MCP2158960.1 drug resistance transporter, EmrB/QacA subfamily [Williamsia serinedens]
MADSPTRTASDTSVVTPPVGAAIHPRPAIAWAAFAACLIAVFMQMVDTTIVNIALPDLARDLAATSSDQLLVLTVYTLAFACTLMAGSRLGERVGRHRMFVGALAAFTIASVLCGTATGPTELIVLRGVQGVSAACASAQTIAVIATMFPRARHPLVFGVYGATAGIAAICGPVVGGALISADVAGLGWRVVFLVNMPFGVIACLVAWRCLPVMRAVRDVPLDLRGAVLSSSGLFALIYPLAVGREKGWPAWTWVLMGAAVILVATFLVHERSLLDRGGQPLLRVDLFRSRAFAVGCVLSIAFFGVFGAFFFAMSVTAQFGLGYSALRTGLITLPFALGAAAGSVGSSLIVPRLGARTLALGMAVFAVAVAWTAALLDPSSAALDLPPLIPALVLGGVGVGLFVAPLQATIVSGTTEQTVGSASGMVPTVQQIGASVGLAVVGVFFFAQVAGAAPSAATQSGERLTASLRTTPVPTEVAPFVVGSFTDCARRQLSSTRPEVAPPGCSTRDAGTGPRARVLATAGPALRDAADHAAARAFLAAFTTTLWTIAATALVLAAACLALRRTPAEPVSPAGPRPRAA